MKSDDFRIRDPFVLLDGGLYYLYESTAGGGPLGVSVRTSRDLADWSAPRQVMQVPSGARCTAVWAPEVHRHAGRYYLFTTLTQERGVRPVEALSPEAKPENLVPRGTWGFVADSPEGPFLPVKEGPLPPQEHMTLDGTLFVEDGIPYMVYCHEWCQTGNGLMEYAPMTPELDGFTAPPRRLFDARGAMDGARAVTDGPFFLRSQHGPALFMIWSNFIEGYGYCVLWRRSESGRLAGPWSKDALLFCGNGGHGMLFQALDGRTYLPLHQPNNSPMERMKLFEVNEDGTQLTCKQ